MHNSFFGLMASFNISSYNFCKQFEMHSCQMYSTMYRSVAMSVIHVNEMYSCYLMIAEYGQLQ